MWRFDTDAETWEYVGGPKVMGERGTYGDRNVEVATNWPGARSQVRGLSS